MKLQNEKGEWFEFTDVEVPTTNNRYGILTELNTGKRWRAEEGGRYWSSSAYGAIEMTERNDEEDDYYYNTGDYFQTEEQALAHREFTLAKQRLKDYIREGNARKGWKADWNNRQQEKWLVFYDHTVGGLYGNKVHNLQCYEKWRYGHREVIKSCMEHCADDWKLYFEYGGE